MHNQSVLHSDLRQVSSCFSCLPFHSIRRHSLLPVTSTSTSVIPKRLFHNSHKYEKRTLKRPWPLLPTYLPTYLPTHPPIYLPTYPCCSRLEHRASVKRLVSHEFLNLRQSVGLLRRGISRTQGRYLHKHGINANIHALSGIRTLDPSVRAGEALDRVATVTGRVLLNKHKLTKT
jgi:hypothetical protein